MSLRTAPEKEREKYHRTHAHKHQILCSRERSGAKSEYVDGTALEAIESSIVRLECTCVYTLPFEPLHFRVEALENLKTRE